MLVTLHCEKRETIIESFLNRDSVTIGELFSVIETLTLTFQGS